METNLAPENLSQRWQIKANVRIAATADDHVVLNWLGQRILIKTPLARSLAPVLDGLREPRTVPELAASLDEAWNQSTLTRFLHGLAKHRLIVAASSAEKTENCRTSKASVKQIENLWRPYFQLFATSEDQSRAALERLLNVNVHLITSTNPPAPFLSGLPILPTTPDENAFLKFRSLDIAVLLVAANDLALIESMAQPATEARALVLPVLSDPFGAIVGPLVGGAGRPCLRCVSRRLGSNLKSVETTFSPCRVDETTDAWPFTYWQKLSAIIHEEIFKVRSELAYSALNRGALLFDFLNHRSDYEEVFPVPGCDCSNGYKQDAFEG